MQLSLPVVDADHDHLETFVLTLEFAHDRSLVLAVWTPGGQEDEHGSRGFALPDGDLPAPDPLGGEGRGLLADRDQALVVGREVRGASAEPAVLKTASAAIATMTSAVNPARATMTALLGPDEPFLADEALRDRGIPSTVDASSVRYDNRFDG